MAVKLSLAGASCRHLSSIPTRWRHCRERELNHLKTYRRGLRGGICFSYPRLPKGVDERTSTPLKGRDATQRALHYSNSPILF
jgi:hypothetical protein